MTFTASSTSAHLLSLLIPAENGSATPDSKPLDRYDAQGQAQNDQPTLANLEASGSTFNCTVPASNDKVECTATFDFNPDYSPSGAGTLKLENNAKIQLGYFNAVNNQFTKYFEITGTTQSFGDVIQGTQYDKMVITWTIQVQQ